LATQYLYDDANLAVSAISGALSQLGRPFTHGFEFYLEKATLSFSFANLAGEGQLAPLSVILADRTVQKPPLGSGDPIDSFAAEISVAAESVAQGVAMPQLSGLLARQALVICHAEVDSVKTGTAVAIL